MAFLSNRDLQNVQKQIVRENSFKQEVKKAIKKEFEDIHKQFLDSFDSHPVTQEIKGGSSSANISKTLGGVGNLFTYIGFESGSDPIKKLRELLDTYEIQYHRRKTHIYTKIEVPTKEEVFAVTPMPWATGRSWARGIERGISGLGQYLVKSNRIRKSKSGHAIQIKGRVRGGRFSNRSYISSLLNDYYKNIKKLEKKTFS
jgi:hypothetical protein|tara:strand:- start:171 stop:773 length:603 start_codon:yes stop_codon:yes gene_type:complete